MRALNGIGGCVMRHTLADIAKVDLGAAHNGRVAWRHVFVDTLGRYIIDKGKRVPVLHISRARAGIRYVVRSL